MSDENKPKELGALWKNKSKKGEEFYTGQLRINDETIPIIIFKNRFKKENKHPDFRIYENEKNLEENSTPAPKQNVENNTKVKKTNIEQNNSDVENDDIPF